MPQPPQFSLRGILLLGTASGALLGLARVITDPKVPPIYSSFSFHLAVFLLGGMLGGLVGCLSGNSRHRTWWGVLAGAGIVGVFYVLAAMLAFSQLPSSPTFSAIGKSVPRCQAPVGRNKPAQFRHRDSAFAVGLPELRRLVPAYTLATKVKLHGA